MSITTISNPLPISNFFTDEDLARGYGEVDDGDLEERNINQFCNSGYDSSDEEVEDNIGNFTFQPPQITSGDKDGPEGFYFKGIYPDLSQHIKLDYSLSNLTDSFIQNYPTPQTSAWSYNIIDTIGNSFGKFSVVPLGNGCNSNAFVMKEKGSNTKHVLRTFSIFNLRHPHLQQQFRLNHENVGGEWLSATLSHPNLAHNSHIVAWDSLDNSFKVLSQTDVQELVSNHHSLQAGRQIYAVATICDYVEGSLDLERVFTTTPNMSEESLRHLLTDIFQGVANMNQQHIIHRDLKAGNIIVLPSDEAKIIDFGSAAQLMPGNNLPVAGDRAVHPYESNFGTIDNPKHTNEKTDSYSVFLLAYKALTGESFFGTKTSMVDIKTELQNVRTNEITKGSFRQILDDDPKLNGVSPTLKDLMAKLGTSNEAERLTAQEALNHPFFASREISQLNAA